MNTTELRDNPFSDIRRRRFVRNAIPVILVSVLVLSILAVGAFAFVSVRIGQMNQGFSEVQVGDDFSRVIQLLGKPDAVKRGDTMSWLSLLDDEDRCSEQYCYTVKTFFLPMTWLVYFDDDGQVIMKHRLD